MYMTFELCSSCSTVGDIHDELEVMVYKVGSRSDLLLGKIKIPLHRVSQQNNIVITLDNLVCVCFS